MHFLLLFILSCASRLPCTELSKLAEEDQLDRKNFHQATDQQLLQLMERDSQRRNKILQLEKQGCLETAADYSDAALIFQHGNSSSDYEHAFRWSSKAYELGDKTQKSMMAMSLDRYLVSKGHRQLFGTQASREAGQACWCLEKVESSFPDAHRSKYTGKTLLNQQNWLDSLNSGLKCTSAFCKKELSSPPKGLIPEW